MLRRIALAVATLVFATAAFAGHFEGTLEFTEPGCEKKGKCVLKSEFGYVDSAGQGWEAKAGNTTDGASIPPKLQGWFGSPFDANLIRAAVIHDHYCDRHVHSWSDTHWVLYDALIASGLNKDRAELMWGGVLLGGPKWIWLIKGEPCHTGQTCIQAQPAPLPSGGTILHEEGRPILYRKPRYDDPAFIKEIGDLKKRISAQNEPLSRAEMESIVKSIRPSDPFINGPDTIATPSGEGVSK